MHYRDIQKGYYQSAGLSYRDQWNQLPDRPKTYALRYNKFIPKSRGTELQLGGYLLHDEIGVFTNTELKLRVATVFQLEKNRNKGFSAGLYLGAGRYQVDLASLAYVELDPTLFRGNEATFSPDLGLGISYFQTLENNDQFQIGISVPQLFGIDRVYRNQEKSFDLMSEPHYFMTASYTINFTEETHLEFSGWAKKVKNVPTNYDINIRYKMYKNLWLGAGVNNGGIIHTEAGIRLQLQDNTAVRFGYAYNPTFHTHSIIFGDIHEINVSYIFE